MSLIFSPSSLKCFPCLLCHGKCVYVFACLNVWACVLCVHVVSLRSQETLLVITRGICSSVMLALVSVTLSCAIYKYYVSSSRWETSVSIFFVFLLFLGWHRAFCCSCTKYLSSLRENGLHIIVGEGVRQRCQRAQWVKGEQIQDEGKELSFLIGKDDWHELTQCV